MKGLPFGPDCGQLYALDISYSNMSGLASMSRTYFDSSEENETMMIDEGMYLVLRSAAGAFICRSPPLPKYWNGIDRPHVAVLVPSDDHVFRVYLSSPSSDIESDGGFHIFELDALPNESIIEIRHDAVEYSYYRKENEGAWTKVAEAQNPFLVEVFSYGLSPIVMNMSEQFSFTYSD